MHVLTFGTNLRLETAATKSWAGHRVRTSRGGAVDASALICRYILVYACQCRVEGQTSPMVLTVYLPSMSYMYTGKEGVVNSRMLSCHHIRIRSRQ